MARTGRTADRASFSIVSTAAPQTIGLTAGGAANDYVKLTGGSAFGENSDDVLINQEATIWLEAVTGSGAVHIPQTPSYKGRQAVGTQAGRQTARTKGALGISTCFGCCCWSL
ncbi:unnamed protein product [Phaeothamnion confervicola]